MHAGCNNVVKEWYRLSLNRISPLTVNTIDRDKKKADHCNCFISTNTEYDPLYSYGNLVTVANTMGMSK